MGNTAESNQEDKTREVKLNTKHKIQKSTKLKQEVTTHRDRRLTCKIDTEGHKGKAKKVTRDYTK